MDADAQSAAARVRAFYTDYPIIQLGDKEGEPAPVRVAYPISYDSDKYVTVIVDGVRAVFKRGYLYTEPGRCGDVPTVSASDLEALVNAVEGFE